MRVFFKNAARRSFFCAGAAALVLGCASCASVGGPALQPEINGLLISGHAPLAAQKIEAGEAGYGSGNYVLYHLDRAMVLAMTGDHAGSAASLEKARDRNEQLYTRSAGKEAMTWLVNDNMEPYRAPDYERVLMNVFQAFNYLDMGKPDEALVEARDLDSRFPVTDGYQDAGRTPEDNGFARLLFGILYEAAGTRQDRNDALISYRQALTVYDAYYDGKYVPHILQEGLLRLAAEFNDPDLPAYRRRFSGVRETVPEDGAAVVYLFESVGFSPVKVPEIIPVPADRGFVTKIAFPKFMDRVYDTGGARLVLQDASGRQLMKDAELGVDIGELAHRDLKARKALVLAKSIARPALKYLAQRSEKEALRKEHGAAAAEVFGLFSNLYNFYTEQADLRSWQSLPAKVFAARLVVRPGPYQAGIESLDAAGGVLAREEAGALDLKAGETYFLIRRSTR